MKVRRIKTCFFIALSVALFSCGSSAKEKTTAPPTARSGPSALPVQGYVIVPETIRPSLKVAGTLLPMEITEIHPEVSGKVVMLSVREGDYVRKGTVLAKLFDEDLRAQLQKLKVQLEVAEKTEQRQSDLLKIGGISQQDYDLSLLNVSALKADIAILQTNIDKTVIRAPFNGRLGFKNISIGAYVTPQTNITTIRQTDVLKLEFSVPEKFSNQVVLGREVEFTSEAAEGTFRAKIVSTESGIDQSTRSLDVRAVVNNSGNRLKAGGFANVVFNLSEDDRAIMVPSQAIIPGARTKEVILYNGGRASFKVVETGVRDEQKIEIIKGLSIGDTLITTGLLSIKEGSPVTISSYFKEGE